MVPTGQGKANFSVHDNEFAGSLFIWSGNDALKGTAAILKALGFMNRDIRILLEPKLVPDENVAPPTEVAKNPGSNNPE